jgi:hypothetical protein
LILTGHKHALQNALNRFFRAVGLLPEGPTASAYSQARQELQPALFQHLNNLVVEKFYTLSAPDGGVKRWQGRRVIGIDGTRINLPDTAATREHYTVHRNQHAGVERVQAVGSVCYDLFNDLALAATPGKQQAEKESLLLSFDGHGPGRCNHIRPRLRGLWRDGVSNPSSARLCPPFASSPGGHYPGVLGWESSGPSGRVAPA